MDERLHKALDFSNYMVTLNNQKKMLQEKFHQQSLHYYKGGQFTVDKELICFCTILVNADNTTTVLVDDNNIPIEIEDLEEFLDDINNVYFSATSEFLNNYNKLKTNRSVEKLIDL